MRVCRNFWRALTAGVGMTLVASQAGATIYTYNGFGDTTGLTLVGNTATAVTSDGTVMRITPSGFGQAGSFYSTSPITLGTNSVFSTTFQFRFTSPSGIDPADGITFVLAASSSGLGGAGGGLGYIGVPNSVAVEFDTFNNGGGDGNSSNHVAIDTNGALDVNALANVYGNGTCDFSALNNYSANGCMSNGHLWSVTIVYDGSFLSVSLTDPALGTAFNAINNYAIDVGAMLGGVNTAYVGFTASTGSGYENHDIVDWQFADTTELGTPNAVPEPSSLALVGVALAGLAARGRRRA